MNSVGIVVTVSQREVERNSLKYSQRKRRKLGDRIEFLSAFLSLFLELFQRRDSDSKKLDNDRRIDIRRDRHCQQSTLTERATCHYIEVIQQRRTAHHCADSGVVKEGNENVGA